MELTYIEGGVFCAGSSNGEVEELHRAFRYAFARFPEAESRSWLFKQSPKVQVAIESFQLGTAPVTNVEYSEFEIQVFGHICRADIARPCAPVEGVTYFESMAFCQWAAGRDGVQYRLPSEWEWEFAASSRGKYRYPWGDTFDPRCANTAEGGRGCVSNVFDYPLGTSEQGVTGLAGNIEEWTASVYLPYPGGVVIKDEIFNENAGVYPILRGGSYKHHGDLCLAARRHGYRRNYTICGFRIAAPTR